MIGRKPPTTTERGYVEREQIALDQLWDMYGQTSEHLGLNHLALLDKAAGLVNASLGAREQALGQLTTPAVLGQPAHEAYIDILQKLLRVATRMPDLEEDELALRPIYYRLLSDLGILHIDEERLAQTLLLLQSFFYFPDTPDLDRPERSTKAAITLRQNNERIAICSMRVSIQLGAIISPQIIHPDLRRERFTRRVGLRRRSMD